MSACHQFFYRIGDGAGKQDPQKGNLPTTYSLKMNSTPRPVSGPRGGSPAGLGLAHQRPPQQTVKQQTDSVVVNRLVDLKISEDKAIELSNRFSQEYIESKIELLNWKMAEDTVGQLVKDPTAWLIRAIERDYKPPKGFKPISEIEKEREKEQLRQKELDTQIQDEREREEQEQAKIIDVYEISEKLLSTWRKVLEGIRSEGNYQALLSRLENSFLLSIENGVSTILVDGLDNLAWIEDRAKSILEARLTGHFGETVKIKFEAIEHSGRDEKKR